MHTHQPSNIFTVKRTKRVKDAKECVRGVSVVYTRSTLIISRSIHSGFISHQHNTPPSPSSIHMTLRTHRLPPARTLPTPPPRHHPLALLPAQLAHPAQRRRPRPRATRGRAARGQTRARRLARAGRVALRQRLAARNGPGARAAGGAVAPAALARRGGPPLVVGPGRRAARGAARVCVGPVGARGRQGAGAAAAVRGGCAEAVRVRV